MKRPIIFISLILWVLLALVLFLSLKGNQDETNHKLPELNIEQLNLPLEQLEVFHSAHNLKPTQSINLKTLKGQWVLANIWASWCIPCQNEHPLLIELNQYFKGKEEAKAVMVGLNYQDTNSKAIHFLSQLGNPFDLSLIAQSELAVMMGMRGVPETYLFSPKGSLVFRKIGELQSSDIDAIKALVIRPPY